MISHRLLVFILDFLFKELLFLADYLESGLCIWFECSKEGQWFYQLVCRLRIQPQLLKNELVLVLSIHPRLYRVIFDSTYIVLIISGEVQS